MADPYPIRPINNDEYDAFRRVTRHAFGAGPVREHQRGALAMLSAAMSWGAAPSCHRIV